MTEDKVSFERKARIASTIGIDPKRRESQKGRLGRRAFGQVVLAGGLAGAAAGLIKAFAEREDRGAEVFPPEGFFGIFQGIVHVGQGAVIYDRPAAWVRSEPEWPYTTRPREETEIEVIDRSEEEFEIKNPILFFRPASQFSTQTAAVGGEGRERNVDLESSYLVFEEEEGMPESVAGSIRRTATKLGCINIGVPGTLEYKPRDEEEFSFSFTPRAVILN
jgi:hypothetical protein